MWSKSCRVNTSPALTHFPCHHKGGAVVSEVSRAGSVHPEVVAMAAEPAAETWQAAAVGGFGRTLRCATRAVVDEPGGGPAT